MTVCTCLPACSALAFGFDALCLLPGCCDPFNEKVMEVAHLISDLSSQDWLISCCWQRNSFCGHLLVCLTHPCCATHHMQAVRASQGAVFRLPLACCSLEELQAAAQKHKLVLVAAEPDAEAGKAAAAQQVSGAPQGVVLVLGSEGSGLSPAVLQVREAHNREARS
jgi:tRNA G18 (ribose-2'-O)-methylase SpoU